VKYHGKNPLKKEYTLEKMKDWNENRSCWGLWYVRGRRENGEGEEVLVRSMYFMYLYENGTMKCVEIILSMRKSVGE
jgi:hypothetical protein